MAKFGAHAVVLGASMGGLLAARVLADFYDAVTVVERDVLPETAANRRGVPQGRHVHLCWVVAPRSWISFSRGSSTNSSQLEPSFR